MDSLGIFIVTTLIASLVQKASRPRNRASLRYNAPLVPFCSENAKGSHHVVEYTTSINPGNISSAALQPVDQDCLHECNECCPIAGKLESYPKHIIFCEPRLTAEQWPKRVEEPNSGSVISEFLALLSEEDAAYIKSLKTSSCDFRPAVEHNKFACIVYPDAVLVVYESRKESVHQVMEYIRTGIIPPPISSSASTTTTTTTTVSSTSSTSTPTIQVRPVPWTKLILVCAHANRDKRCGRAGPQTIAALRSSLQNRGIPDSDIRVLPVSHIGGHALAGTLICYPDGDWYGHMTGSNASSLLDSLLSGGKLSKCWRGNGWRAALDF